MKRRVALKNIGLISSGIFLLPQCNFSDEKVSIILNKLNISVEQENVLRAISETLIPEDNLPGATSLKAHSFVWIMVDDCFSKKEQHSFINGLELFQTFVIQKSDKTFSNLKAQEKLDLLTELYLETDLEEDLQTFLQEVKYFTIQGYMLSEYIMTEVMPFQLVPGSYELCKSIDKTKKINVNA